MILIIHHWHGLDIAQRVRLSLSPPHLTRLQPVFAVALVVGI